MKPFLGRWKSILPGTLFLARFAAGTLCRCPTLTPDEQKDQATYVFVGTVYDLKKSGDHTDAIFDVDDVFKGEPHSQVKVEDSGTGTDCALNLKEGDPYMVYAHWDWGAVTISSCTGTTPAPPFAQVRVLGPSEELKEKMYKELWENCLGKLTTRCCLSSISAMRKQYYSPEPETGCPDGTIPDRLKCAGSERWCIPMTGDDPEHRRSAPSVTISTHTP